MAVMMKLNLLTAFFTGDLRRLKEKQNCKKS